MNPYMRLKENLPHDSSHRSTEGPAHRSSKTSCPSHKRLISYGRNSLVSSSGNCISDGYSHRNRCHLQTQGSFVISAVRTKSSSAPHTTVVSVHARYPLAFPLVIPPYSVIPAAVPIGTSTLRISSCKVGSVKCNRSFSKDAPFIRQKV